MDEQRLAAIIERLQAGQPVSPAEMRLLDRAFLRMPLSKRPNLSDADFAALKAQAWQGIAARSTGKRTRGIRRWLPYAAAVAVLALAVGTWLAISRQPSAVSLAAEEILPGGNRATLTLADGRVIDLSEEQEGIVIKDGITYLDGSQVIENGKLKVDNEGPTFNSITTPKGGTYQVTLPDGSRVWLNSASTLKYPSRFTEDSREVILEGEGFFEIKKQRITGQGQKVEAHDHASFNVVTAAQTVQVLGTEFNISAYVGDGQTKTTLVNGAVQVVNLGAETVHQLRPGQQSTVRGATTETQNVDVENYTAWKDGKIVLEGRTLGEIIPEISRWYDIDVVHEGELPQGTFFGRANRSSQLGTILRLLESAGVDYRLEGRTLFITQKKEGGPKAVR